MKQHQQQNPSPSAGEVGAAAAVVTRGKQKRQIIWIYVRACCELHICRIYMFVCVCLLACLYLFGCVCLTIFICVYLLVCELISVCVCVWVFLFCSCFGILGDKYRLLGDIRSTHDVTLTRWWSSTLAELATVPSSSWFKIRTPCVRVSVLLLLLVARTCVRQASSKRSSSIYNWRAHAGAAAAATTVICWCWDQFWWKHMSQAHMEKFIRFVGELAHLMLVGLILLLVGDNWWHDTAGSYLTLQYLHTFT